MAAAMRSPGTAARLCRAPLLNPSILALLRLDACATEAALKCTASKGSSHCHAPNRAEGVTRGARVGVQSRSECWTMAHTSSSGWATEPVRAGARRLRAWLQLWQPHAASLCLRCCLLTPFLRHINRMHSAPGAASRRQNSTARQCSRHDQA